MDSTQKKQAESWAFFDKIYCISLIERPDRRAKAHQRLAEVGLAGRVEFVLVAKDMENPERGIFASHQQCLSQGLASGAETILIFEDDVFFHHFSPERLHTACDSLRSIPHWDAFVLGGISSGSTKTPVKSLTRIRYRCLAHAYAVHRSFAMTLVEEQWTGTPWDEILRQLGGEFYALYPMCAFQGTEGSDNQTIAIDRTRRLLGGLPFIQRANEGYQNHKLLLILAPLCMTVGLAVFLLQTW